MVQENASDIFSIIVFSELTLEDNVTFQKFHRKKKMPGFTMELQSECCSQVCRECMQCGWRCWHLQRQLKAAEIVCFHIPAELREFILMEWSQGNLSVFITFPLLEEAKQLSHHLRQSEFASELLPSDLPATGPLSLILVSLWLRTCHITQGDQEKHLASARSLLPFLFRLVFHWTRCAFSGEVDVRLAVAPNDGNSKATWQLSYCCPKGH